MTIHIGIDGTNSNKYVSGLKNHFQFKNYKVLTIDRKNNDVSQEFSGNELYLYKAFNETQQLSLIPDIDYYDIVLYNTSMLSDYLDASQDNLYWLRQINNKCIKKDMYIYIKPEKKPILFDRINYFKNSIILNDSCPINYNFNLIENQLNDMFQTCNWCGNFFKKDKHHIKYCSKTCSSLANQKQTRDRVNKFNRKYRNVQSPHEKNMLGSNALLKSRPNTDFQKEQKIIKNEKRRLGI